MFKKGCLGCLAIVALMICISVFFGSAASIVSSQQPEEQKQKDKEIKAQQQSAKEEHIDKSISPNPLEDYHPAMLGKSAIVIWDTDNVESILKLLKEKDIQGLQKLREERRITVTSKSDDIVYKGVLNEPTLIYVIFKSGNYQGREGYATFDKLIKVK